MADVHEVQEANDKSKFHRQIKNVLECEIKTGQMSLGVFNVFSNGECVQDQNDLPQTGRSMISGTPKFAETTLILLKYLCHIKFLAIAVKVLQKRFVRRFVC